MKFFALTLAIFFTSCQLPLANYFRDEVFPEDETAKIALSPILLPTYGVLSVVDAAIVNPARGTKNVPKTVGTIWEWENKNWPVGYIALMPLKLIAIPPTALGITIFSEQFIYDSSVENVKE